MNICTMYNLAASTVTRYIADLQNTFLDMLSCVETKLVGDIEVDATYLGGPKNDKKSGGGRVLGKTGRRKEKTLLIAQQRKSQRFAVLQSDRHENCEAADELAKTIESGPGTTIFTDGGITIYEFVLFTDITRT